MHLITLKTFDNSIDANMLRCQLELEGIQSYLKDENTITTNPLYNLALGGIKLQVFEQDQHYYLEMKILVRPETR